MKLLAIASLCIGLVACGGASDYAGTGSSTVSHVSILSEGMRTQSVVTAPSITVARVYQALNGKASGNAAFASAVIQVGSTNGFDWANLQAAAKASLSDSAFATLVLNNISITPTSLTATAAFGTSQQAYDGLQRALTEYLAVFAPKGVGRGTVVLQLANIIAGLEIDNTFGVYSPAAIAFNKQITANVAYSNVTSNVADAEVTTALAAPTAVTVAATGTQTVGTLSFGSSTQLAVSWVAPTAYAVDHYVITATEPTIGASSSTSASGNANRLTLTALKAATDYAVVVQACRDSACAASGSASLVRAATPAEYWQLQGSGNTIATLSKPVADGNARLSATRFGPEAGTNANTVQFYYGPLGVSGMSMATSGTVSSASPASYLNFTSFATTSGLRSPSNPTVIKDIMTGQGVPLSSAMGGKVRLFFESNDSDGKTRIYSVDSVDGYVGRDFNSGTATTCTTSADYLATGNCPATLVLGVEGDAINPNPKLKAVRQKKIAWPTMTDWRWDGAVGTFMVFTFDQVSGCTTATHNHGYAVWDGAKFVVQYDAAGCPKAFKSAQAALPMHLGGVRYKMYFGDPSLTTGKTTTSKLPFVGPKKLLYADGKATGSASTVEFEDWEGVASARNVHFLWPNGELLNDKAEGYIDDFHFLTPTGSLDLQVLYLSITDGNVVPFAAAAILLNP